MKHIWISILFIAATAVAADEPEMAGEEGYLTDWDTMLAADIDSGWHGNWTLQSATMTMPNGSIQFPTAGHRLSLDYHGNYTLDYSTAYFLAEIQVHTGAFSGSMATTPPAGLMPAGVPQNCAVTAEFSGSVSGRLFAPFDLDLDRLNSDGEAVYGLPWMQAALNPATSTKPEIHCPGAEVTVRSSGTVLPLGAGRAVSTANGMAVSYDYEMDSDLTTLIIRARTMPRITYIFSKSG